MNHCKLYHIYIEIYFVARTQVAILEAPTFKSSPPVAHTSALMDPCLQQFF
jgi:hypothetical protein